MRIPSLRGIVMPTLVAGIHAASILVTIAAAPAFAQNGQQQLGDALQKLLNSPEQQEKLQQGIAVASLLGCTGKTAGRAATDAFYKDMQARGKQIEQLCKAKRADAARALTIRTLKEQQNNPVRLAASQCYSTQKADFDTLAGPKLANDAEQYARWIADPALAEAEMMPQDICK